MERKNIVILTKSRMNNAYCVAGIDIDSGGWVRLVSDKNGSPLDTRYTSYCNTYGECCTLDVVSVDIIARVPIRNQQENGLINAGSMSKRGRCSLSQVLRLHPAENNGYIFGNASKYLTENDMQQFNYSLILVHVKDLIITVSDYRKSKANFIYNGIQYKYMSVTDPEYFSEKTADGTKLNNAYIVVSMPKEPFIYEGVNRYYKFIAKIFPA